MFNNAEIMAVPYATTDEEFETQFGGANYIGDFLLTRHEADHAQGSCGWARRARRQFSSPGHRFGLIRFEDLRFNGGKTYSQCAAYGQSKSANTLFSVELAIWLSRSGVTSVLLYACTIWTKLAVNANL